MTPQSRLTLWYIAIIAVVFTQHLWFEYAAQFRVVGLTIVTTLLLTITALLLSTPSNAIRLKPRRSFVILTFLTVLLYGHAILLFTAGIGERLTVGFALLTAIFFTEVAVHKRRSPWWVVPLCWNPLMVGPYALADTTVIALAGVMLAGMLVLPRKSELTA